MDPHQSNHQALDHHEVPQNSHSHNHLPVMSPQTQTLLPLSSSTAGVLNSATTCWIVPVVLYHKDNPSNKVKTYALLDDASDTTFITNKLKSEIGIEGVSTSLNLCNMLGGEIVPVSLVDGLVVERPNRRAKVDPPKAYARDSIPSRKDQIPNKEIADKWYHLKKIKEKISRESS